MKFTTLADHKPNPFLGDHTPGPWALEQTSEGQVSTVIGGPIAVVGGETTDEGVEFTIGQTGDYGPHGNKQTTANAHLIATAPELYVLLAELAYRSEEKGYDFPCMPAVHKALNKVVGIRTVYKPL